MYMPKCLKNCTIDSWFQNSLSRLKSCDCMVLKFFAKKLCCVDTCTYLHLILLMNFLRKFFIFFMVLGSFIFKGSFPSKCSEHVVLLHFMMLWLDLSFSVCLCMVGWRGRSGNQMRHSDEVSLKDLESQATSRWHLFLFSFPLPCKPSHSVGVEQQQVSFQPFYSSCLRKEAGLWYHRIWNTV